MDRNATFPLTPADKQRAKAVTLDSAQGVVRDDGSL